MAKWASHIRLIAARVSNFRSLQDVEVKLNELRVIVKCCGSAGHDQAAFLG